jgi:ABC-type multidrug transport system permease subunit
MKMATAQILLFIFGLLMFGTSIVCGIVGFRKSSPGMWILCIFCMGCAIDIVGRATGFNLFK